MSMRMDKHCATDGIRRDCPFVHMRISQAELGQANESFRDDLL